MVKHNNELPNVHLHKWWQRYVKTWFDQPGRKQSRRIARQKKAAKLGVRPIGMLRPIVHPPTQRYNIKIREGRGFTLDELKVSFLINQIIMLVKILANDAKFFCVFRIWPAVPTEHPTSSTPQSC
eukprot:GHVT01100538.1.p1 GENE.GHVT01100538.1~~GHVT01100538.1.p1  ORF type:complete len:142 (+),score=9.67 GHVT01100538.1:54-428(+)